MQYQLHLQSAKQVTWGQTQLTGMNMQHAKTCWGLCIANIHSVCHGVHSIFGGRHCSFLSKIRTSMEVPGFSSTRMTLTRSLLGLRCSLPLRTVSEAIDCSQNCKPEFSFSTRHVDCWGDLQCCMQVLRAMVHISTA